ncbi:unnamed protein product [marine sediment metagenome]|uniref:Uncharacterized protein n=1 Tax=marine sediment metagenome TaxID=412755 RepID=X1G166_9ZZZZ
MKKAGVRAPKGTGFYTLRRTVATMAARSADPFAVQRLLGHANLKMVREELRALGIRTVRELKLFDEGSWTEYISRVKWDREQFGKKGILYREDLLRKREAGDLEHIPGKAEVNRICFKNPGPIPELSILEQLQELRIDVESNVSGDILAMCKWPGLPLFEQCKNSNDVFQLINSKRQNPKDVLKKMIYVQENYLSYFRMLKRNNNTVLNAL